MTSRRTLTRRHVLRGAGVALALPWLESLASRHALGRTPSRLRFVPVYFPMGTAPFWAPKAMGNTLELSPILEPLAPLKEHVTVLSHVGNSAYGAAAPAPSFARETGSFLTCVPALGAPARNGKSVDQVIADGLFGEVPPTRSLQLGLSTLASSTEDLAPGFARGISWSDAATPLPRQVNPQAVFDLLVAASPFITPADPATLARRATHKSVLDFVADDSSALQARVGKSDRIRLDKFMTSVRNLERRIVQPLPPACASTHRPPAAIDVGNVPPGYDRDAHAEVMIDLMVMALGCNLSRVISLMLDDAGSDFAYDFLQQRTFTDAGSTSGTARVGAYRALATGGAATTDGYATINRWFVTKLASLCQRLAAIDDPDGRNALDNSVLWFGSGMHDGQSRSPADLPLLYVGSAGGALKVGQHLDLQGTRSLSDVYLTIVQKVFAIGDQPTFADSRDLAVEILA